MHGKARAQLLWYRFNICLSHVFGTKVAINVARMKIPSITSKLATARNSELGRKLPFVAGSNGCKYAEANAFDQRICLFSSISKLATESKNEYEHKPRNKYP